MKTPELLAKYCDTILRKSSKNKDDQELEKTIDDAMIVFNYLCDKDVFQEFYSKLLAKRLVLKVSASDDAEASMISKLKITCGFEYTKKLQRMFQDVGLSRNLNQDYKKVVVEGQINQTFDFQIMVLTSGSWPFSQGPPLNLPVEVSFSMKISLKYSNPDDLPACWNRSALHQFLRTEAFRQKIDLASPAKQRGSGYQLFRQTLSIPSDHCSNDHFAAV